MSEGCWTGCCEIYLLEIELEAPQNVPQLWKAICTEIILVYWQYLHQSIGKYWMCNRFTLFRLLWWTILFCIEIRTVYCRRIQYEFCCYYSWRRRLFGLTNLIQRFVISMYLLFQCIYFLQNAMLCTKDT